MGAPMRLSVEALGQWLGGAGAEADALRDLIACMRSPTTSSEQALPNLGDRGGRGDRRASSGDQTTAAVKDRVEEDREEDREKATLRWLVEHSQMTIACDEPGEQPRAGLFPLCSLCRPSSWHSCDPNAAWRPLHGGRALAVEAARLIHPGDLICSVGMAQN